MRENTSCRPLRVLVVDDDEDQREILSMLLGFWGHDVLLAEDGSSALVATQTFQPEVVLLDIGMPGLSGWEVARRLRQQSDCPNRVLIAVSGYVQEQDRARSHEVGFNAHLTKPTDLKELQRLLAKATAAFDLAGAA